MLRGMLIIKEPPGGMVKEFGQLMRRGLLDLAENWHLKILPHHFTKQAQQKYEYAARTVNYLRYKAKKKPMAEPLEFSGKSKHELTRSIRKYVRLTRAEKEFEVRGVMKAPRYFWMTPKNQPNKPAEMLRILPKELRAFAQRLNERVTGQLNKVSKITQIYR